MKRSFSRAAVSHPLRRRGSCALLETDGLTALAHGFDRDGTLLASARAASARPMADAGRALDELCSRLPRRPRELFVVTEEAWGGILEVSAALLRRRPDEIHESVRWEIEGRLAQRAGTRPMGALLVGMGLLEPQRLEELLALQEQESAPYGSTPRLGELARQHAGLDAAALERALELQGWLAGAEEELRCGWRAAPPSAASSRAPLSAVGIGAGRLAAWQDLARERGLVLGALFAREAAPLALLPPAALAEGSSILLLEPSWGSLVRPTARGALPSEPIQPRAGRWKIEELRGLLAGEDPTRCWIDARRPELAELEEELLASFQDARVLLPRAGALPAQSAHSAQSTQSTPTPSAPCALSSATLGVARHLAGAASCVELAALGPGAPRDRTRGLRAAGLVLAALLVAAALHGLEAALDGRRARLADELAELAGQRRGLELARQSTLESNRRSDALEAELTDLARRAADLSARLVQQRASDAARRAAQDRRRALVPTLLAGLQASVGGGVQVLSLRSPDPGSIELEARATSAVAGQAFLEALARDLAPLGYRPARSASSAAPNAPGGEHRIEAAFTLEGPR